MRPETRTVARSYPGAITGTKHSSAASIGPFSRQYLRAPDHPIPPPKRKVTGSNPVGRTEAR